jgi:hypothetical protein
MKISSISTKIITVCATCKKFFVKIFANQNLVNTALSIMAFVISMVSLFIAWRGSTVDTADKQYKFWYELNASYVSQQNNLGKLYPAIESRVTNAAYIYRQIKNNKILCDALPPVKKSDVSMESNRVSRYEDSEVSILKTTTLELQPLASSLTPMGWSEFLSNAQYSYRWWTQVSWESMQLSLLPADFQLDCAVARRTSKSPQVSIKVSQKSLSLLKSDIWKLYKITPYIEGNETPNLESIKSLEDENQINENVSKNTIHTFYHNSVAPKMNELDSYILYIASGVPDHNAKVVKSGN